MKTITGKPNSQDADSYYEFHNVVNESLKPSAFMLK